ncbi:MAG: putative ABC transporter permease [Clostridia bacterium]|nr:putative ABC transporter permease [Clostridia bacterium]
MQFKYDVYSLMIMVAVISFLGFVLENIWLAITKGYVDNRNMSLPFLIGYGLLVVGIYIFIGLPQSMSPIGNFILKKLKLKRYVLYFILAFIIVSIGEILLGLFVKLFFGFDYWNYSRLPLHFTKYTSIPTSIGFASIILFFMSKCFAPIMDLINLIPLLKKAVIGISLIIIMAADFMVSFFKMYKNRSLNIKWKRYIVKGDISTAKY